MGGQKQRILHLFNTRRERTWRVSGELSAGAVFHWKTWQESRNKKIISCLSFSCRGWILILEKIRSIIIHVQADEFDCVRFFADPKQMNREEMVLSVLQKQTRKPRGGKVPAYWCKRRRQRFASCSFVVVSFSVEQIGKKKKKDQWNGLPLIKVFWLKCNYSIESVKI